MGWRLAHLCDYRGYEPDVDSYQVATQRIADLERGAVVNTPVPLRPDRHFDRLLALEVLEHVSEDTETLRRWMEWVKPGGYVLISVSANPGRFGPQDHAVGHYRRYTRDEWERLLVRASVQPMEIWVYGFPLGYALEFARNRLASRVQTESMSDRTAASGRSYQPGDRLGPLTLAGTLPFRWLQNPFVHSSLGTGLVALGRRDS